MFDGFNNLTAGLVQENDTLCLPMISMTRVTATSLRSNFGWRRDLQNWSLSICWLLINTPCRYLVHDHDKGIGNSGDFLKRSLWSADAPKDWVGWTEQFVLFRLLRICKTSSHQKGWLHLLMCAAQQFAAQLLSSYGKNCWKDMFFSWKLLQKIITKTKPKVLKSHQKEIYFFNDYRWSGARKRTKTRCA